MKYTFNNRIAVVTGASRGIGEAVAMCLASEGCKVMCVGRDKSTLENVVDKIKKNGGFAEAFEADVASSESVNACAELILEKHEKVDILVNCAGIAKDNLLIWMDDKEWDDVIKTNLYGAFYTTRAFVRSMISNRWGRIIYIGSISGNFGGTGLANYAASKAGLVGLMKTLAIELGGRQITANVIEPGLVETDMIKVLPKEALDDWIATSNRLGKPDDIANACRFLASEEASYMTGEVLAINGGKRL